MLINVFAVSFKKLLNGRCLQEYCIKIVNNNNKKYQEYGYQIIGILHVFYEWIIIE